MNTIFTPAELQAKGITEQMTRRALKASETRVSSYVKQYARNGNQCSASFQAAWDAECARWDHLKATLAQFA
jgi:hypothetical protein